MAGWFKFYNATIHDRRFKHIARKTGRPNAEVLGIWITTLALANDSPEPGRLLMLPDIPMNISDIADLCGVPFEVARDIFIQFKHLGLIGLIDSAWEVIGWSAYKAPKRYRDQKRLSILERDGHVCRYCGKAAEHVDHVIPKSQGGPDDSDNLVAACAFCNQSKGARTPEQAGMVLHA